MHTSVIRNPLSRVFFAGFQSTTLDLQRAGWQLSMEQHFSYDGLSLRLALKHEAGRVLAITHPVSSYHLHRAMGFKEMAPIDFQIAWIGNDARFHIMAEMRPMSFNPISAIPEFQDIKDLSFEEAIPFRPLNPNAPEIIIPPSSVPELMDMILKLQDPKQKEIRDNVRRDAWRRDVGAKIGDEGYKPAADIKAQIIALAG